MRHMIHTRETQQLVTFLGRARVDFPFFFEKVIRFHMCYWHRILKLLKLHCVWKDFDMRARRPRACALCVIFCKGWWPWHVRNRCCRSSKSVKKLLAQALFTEMFKKIVVLVQIRTSAREEILTIFFEKPLGFWCFYVKIVTKPKVLEGFRLARANVHFTLFFARDSWNLMM